MQFKDAAYEILKEARESLHYTEITQRALERGILDTTGQTPHATMGALLYTDTLKPNSRFVRGDRKGTFALREKSPSGIKQRIHSLNLEVHRSLLKRLHSMDPRAFEKLVESLLAEIGLTETRITSYSNDGGIDVRGVLNAEDLSRVNIAVQAKRWKKNVGTKVVRELRGSLKVHEQGVIVTPSGFTAKAREEAQEAGKVHISLIDGEQLVELMIRHQMGVRVETQPILELDDDYWSEIIGEFASPAPRAERAAKQDTITFPLPLQARYKGQTYPARLLNRQGEIEYEGKVYPTPTTAAKLVTANWKAVNGWDLWRYQNPETGKWERIGRLKAR